MSTLGHSFSKLAFSIFDMMGSLVSGAPIVIQDQALDRQCQLACKLGNALPKIETMSPERARRFFEWVFSYFENPPLGLGSIEDRILDTTYGTRLPIRIYNSNPQRQSQPILIYYHGGGFTIGSLDTHDSICRRLSYFTKSIVIASDYRLAPEHPYPAAHEDAYFVFSYAKEFAYLLGGDPKVIGVAGDSAGALLSHAVSYRCLREGKEPPLFQALLYPVTDVSRESRSYELYGDGFGLTKDTMRWFKQNYTPQEKDRQDPLVSPLLSPIGNLKGLPPTYVATAGFDPLSGEGKDYVQLLTKAGVSVHHIHFPSLIHGYLQMTGMVDKAKEAESDFHSWVATFLSIRNL